MLPRCRCRRVIVQGVRDHACPSCMEWILFLQRFSRMLKNFFICHKARRPAAAGTGVVKTQRVFGKRKNDLNSTLSFVTLCLRGDTVRPSFPSFISKESISLSGQTILP